MLTITFVNISGPGVEVADYDVRVFVNGNLIHGTSVKGHPRNEGWQALVQRLAQQSEIKPKG